MTLGGIVNDEAITPGDEPAMPAEQSSAQPSAALSDDASAAPMAAASEPAASEHSGGGEQHNGAAKEPEGASKSAPQAKPKPAPAREPEPPAEPRKMDWYILKVQSNREESIKDALQRRIAIQGLQDYFGEIIVPTEMVSEFKNGKKRIVKRKLYPGYIVVRMEITEDTWFLVRETPGIGDFTGSGGKPTPMAPQDVAKIIAKQEEKTDEAPKLSIKFQKGDRVKVTEGNFETFEGEIDAVDLANGRVTVLINIFGRSTPVDFDYWQLESL